ncbi:helix-turn-helix domain-containing protein [Deinococcus aquiradiocola]|uniref:Histidine kinase n=1 Tax=Deinococcus aquiradiocola TaxID=393059 RepID=A0A917PBW2_9DEIO|nr:helix-turn-helix domain-containing protein [Deinococcus aquiradiocola]GGJ69905.1 histidine kinase [Deinococcus aquiradiocola]
METFLTTREAADRLGVSLRTVQQWVEQGALQAYKTHGGHRRILRSSLDRMLAERESALRGHTLKVLVVEDDAALLRLYTLTLGGWDLPLDLRATDNGIQALVEVGAWQPDVLILDLHLPGLDGFELVRRLNALVPHPALIVVTGLDPHEIGARGGLPPELPVLPKPVPFAVLKRHLETLLQPARPALERSPA